MIYIYSSDRNFIGIIFINNHHFILLYVLPFQTIRSRAHPPSAILHHLQPIPQEKPSRIRVRLRLRLKERLEEIVAFKGDVRRVVQLLRAAEGDRHRGGLQQVARDELPVHP